jgi:hypothetical protein
VCAYLGCDLFQIPAGISVNLSNVSLWFPHNSHSNACKMICLVTASVVPSSPILVTLMKEVLSSSEMSVLTRATRRNTPEDTILRSHRRENLKSYNTTVVLVSGFSERNNLTFLKKFEVETSSVFKLILCSGTSIHLTRFCPITAGWHRVQLSWACADFGTCNQITVVVFSSASFTRFLNL